MEPIDLSIGRPGTTTKLNVQERQIKSKETNHLLEERLEKLESNHKMADRNGKILEIKLAQEIIDLKEGLNYVVSEVTNAHQRIDDHEKEMKQLDLQRQFLWARLDDLRVQMVPLEKTTENNRTRIPIPGSVRGLCSILEKGRRALMPNPGKENEQTSICEKEGDQLPNPGIEQTSTHEIDSAQIPNPGNESEQASATCEKDSVLLANPNNEREQNEQAQMVTGGIERVWIPIENEPNLLDQTNTISMEDSLITTERADMAVKAVDDVNNPTESSIVEQDTNSNVGEAIQFNTPSKKSTFSCKICLMEFSSRFNLRSHKSIQHSRRIDKKRFLRKGLGSWNCLYCKKKFKYAKSCEHHEFSCTNPTKENQGPVSSDSNEESIPTTENLQTIFPDSGTENGNHDIISALDISDSQMKINNNLLVPRRRSKTTHENSNPLKPPRKSEKGSPSDNPRKELWKCSFCQKGFTSAERYRHNHEFRCPSRNRSNPKAVSTDSSVESAQVKSLKHGRNKRYGKNPFECDVCGLEFLQKTHLRRHKLKHYPQNWMQCVDCDYRTPRRDCLSLHIRLKHTI